MSSNDVVTYDPAHQISAPKDTLAQIGFLCAVHSQIDLEMTLTVMALLRVHPKTATEIMGSTNVQRRIETYKSILQDKCDDRTLQSLSKEALSLLAKHPGTRNDLIHGVWGVHGDGRPALMKSKTLKPSKAHENIHAVITDLCKASRILAHVTFCVSHPRKAHKSPWQDKLS